MFDLTAKQLVAYEEEQNNRRAIAQLARLMRDCPNCGNLAILPSGDYICESCRENQ